MKQYTEAEQRKNLGILIRNAFDNNKDSFLNDDYDDILISLARFHNLNDLADEMEGDL